ncbi:methylase [Prosthecochloris marina]|uniref:Methylase n=1 Tax=Prosthecochloris marina TaxID=2017681 RepID=A0A317T4Y8_9CHLB|nr:radical SAM protein [Prosthecochloris marina]PWW81694.1 methylase [Prosthecochloris marina]
MAYFNHVCLVEAPQAASFPFPQYVSDIIGICSLAASIEGDVESLVIPDNYYNSALFDSFERLLKRHRIELVGISSMTGGFNNAKRLAEIARTQGAFVVMGGFHPTAMHEEVLKLSSVDVVVAGEGENTFRELVLNGPSRNVKGIAFRENGGIVYNGPRETIRDVDTIAFPLRSLRPERYGEKGQDYSVDTIFTSRGCPWACSFCANDQMHKKWRGRSPENVVDEIALIHDPAKKKYLKIWDANFLTDIERVEEICDMMIERELTNFRITTETRAKDVLRSERVLDKLRRVGLKKIGLGIESPNQETLKLMKKKNTHDEVQKAIELASRYGIGTEGFFIIGHNNENKEDTKAYPEFARSVGLRKSLFFVMTPYPGTKVYREYEEKKKIVTHDWDLYNNFCPVIEAGTMTRTELATMMIYCFTAFGSLPSMIKRKSARQVCLVLLRDLFQHCVLLFGNKSLGEREVRDILYDSFLLLADNEAGVVEKKSSIKQMSKPFALTLQHSQGKQLAIEVHQNGEECKVLVKNDFSETKKRRNPVISLESLTGFVRNVPEDTLMGMLYRNECVRNNPDKWGTMFFPILGEPGMWSLLRQLTLLVYRSLNGSAGKP